MNLIKLSATTTTQDYLKKMAETTELKNFTVVWADYQTQGRGQMGTQWASDCNNGLTFSVLVHLNLDEIKFIYKFNALIVCAILNAFELNNLTKVYVKWPNDILADNKKIAGILIENSFKSSTSIQSVIGIGINLFELDFKNLPQAGSILSVFNKKINAQKLLEDIVEQMKILFESFPANHSNIWLQYHNHLFKKDVVSSFELPNGSKINGIIKSVSDEGQLVVLHENDTYKQYSLKEIKLLY